MKAVTKVTFRQGAPVVPAAADGPVPVMLATETSLARSGAIDADLLANHAFYGTDFTKPLLFLEDGQYFSNVATAQHLTGAQWGVMNETGSYPGQPWLWLYTLWYQVPGFDNSANVDLIAIYLTGVHRLIWRDWYRRGDGAGTPPPVPNEGTVTSVAPSDVRHE